ncbi:MAG: CDP-alcohol phosphatidyltransferase family protein [Gemmatimonadaceae bacterium]
MHSTVPMNLPNLVSLSRLVLAVAFIAINDSAVRVALILAAAFTDFLDGWLARRQHTSSSMGALIDPIADRAFVLTALSVYLYDGKLTTPEYFIVLSRDFATAIGFLVARVVPWLRPAVFQARMLGKTVTVLQLTLLVLVLVWPAPVGFLVLAIGAFSAASIVDYTLALWHRAKAASAERRAAADGSVPPA